MKTLLKTLVCIAGAAVLFVSSAHAATVSITTDDPTAALFNPLADVISGTVFENTTGSVAGLRRSPWETVAGLEGGAYTSVSGNSWASYDLGSLMNSLAFMWGSVDTYNTIEFFNNGNKLNETIVGQDAITAGATVGLEFVIATIRTDGFFDEIRFLSDSNAFEYANIEVSAVPLPAALPLYGAGIALIGFFGWRKRKAAA